MVSEKSKKVNVQKKKFGVVKRLQKQGGWTSEEDALLLEAVKKYKESNWASIAECVPSRTSTQCLHRYRKVLDPSISKSPWTKEEDMLLIKLATEFGARSWSAISARMVNRNAKQIRERYMNHLAPGIKKGVWDQEELDILVKAHKEHGNKWSVISELVTGRSPNACKNQFHAYQQRIKKGLKPRRTKSSINPPVLSSQLPAQNTGNQTSPQKPVEIVNPVKRISASSLRTDVKPIIAKTTSVESLNSLPTEPSVHPNHETASLKSGIESQHSPMSPENTEKRHHYNHQQYPSSQIVNHLPPPRTTEALNPIYVQYPPGFVSTPPHQFSQFSSSNYIPISSVNQIPSVHQNQMLQMAYSIPPTYSISVPSERGHNIMAPNNFMPIYNDLHYPNEYRTAPPPMNTVHQGYEAPIYHQRDDTWFNRVEHRTTYHTPFVDHHTDPHEIQPNYHMTNNSNLTEYNGSTMLGEFAHAPEFTHDDGMFFG